MAETARRRLRDILADLVPPWLSDRVGKNVGYRFLWAIVALFDHLIEIALQGLVARFPGAGTNTALPLIGRSRGIPRGRNETASSYAERLRTFLEQWSRAGSDEETARQLQAYLNAGTRIRVFRRKDGACLTLNADGTVVRHATTAWDWDSVSHPERAGFWSEEWIVVYSTPFALRPGTIGDVTGMDGRCLGHMSTPQEADVARGILGSWKSAHTRVRAVIFTSDASLFDPDTPASMPDGTWGAWSTRGSSSRVASGRNLTTCRYWEPR